MKSQQPGGICNLSQRIAIFRATSIYQDQRKMNMDRYDMGRYEQPINFQELVISARPETSSSKRFVDHHFPDAFGFENQFNGLADRAVSREGFRCIVSGVFYLGNGIAHRDGQARAPH